MWHLTTRVPLHFAAIPETEIAQACQRFNMTLDTWRRQERAFSLLKKVYAKRASIRGDQQSTFAPSQWPQQFQESSANDETDEYSTEIHEP